MVKVFIAPTRPVGCAVLCSQKAKAKPRIALLVYNVPQLHSCCTVAILPYHTIYF
jgi:hypothetical protein